MAGVSPRGVDRQTPVKTVPYRRTTYAVGNQPGSPKPHPLSGCQWITAMGTVVHFRIVCAKFNIDAVCFHKTTVKT